MRRQAAAKIDQGIGKQKALQEETQETKHPAMTTFRADPGKRRKPGTGCVTQISDHLWEGRYSPRGPDGRQRSRNVYGHTLEECEEKLKVPDCRHESGDPGGAEVAPGSREPAVKAKKETPADAGGFLSVVFLWSIKNEEKSGHCKSTKKLQKTRKEPDLKGNQALFGEDYWTRTSDLLRVKIRLDIKCLLLGTFRYFSLRFSGGQVAACSTVSTR